MLHTFKIRSRMSLVPDSRSVPRRQPVPVSLRLTLDPTHPVTSVYQTQDRTSIKGNDYFVQICRYPITSACFYTPGPSFVFSSVNRPCTISPAPVRAFSRLNLLKSIPIPCHARWSQVWYFSLLTLFNFSATVLIRIAEVSRPVRPCVLCVRR